MVIVNTKALSTPNKIKLLRHILQSKFWAKHTYFNSRLLQCDTMCFDKQFPVLQRNRVPPFERSNSPRWIIVLGLLDPWFFVFVVYRLFDYETACSIKHARTFNSAFITYHWNSGQMIEYFLKIMWEWNNSVSLGYGEVSLGEWFPTVWRNKLPSFKAWVANRRPAGHMWPPQCVVLPATTFVNRVYGVKLHNKAVWYTIYCYFSTCGPRTSPK
jgi:hypothetical protein